ncbi:MAG: thiamine phosphate synthase [Acetobacteraceae bacterium]|nr:thiamine phosphate synthase [Acetobacteraceae bacterium]
MRPLSAHSTGPGDAATAGVNFVFLSPAFPTASHPGGAALGAARWSRLAARSAAPVAALGGIDGTACAGCRARRARARGQSAR